MVIHKDAPVFKHPGYVYRVRGLPAIGMLPTIVTMVHELVESYPDSSSLGASNSEWPSKKIRKRLEKALKVASQTTLVPLDDAFNEEARTQLEELSTLAPQFSTDLARLIRVFKKSETSKARPMVPSGQLLYSAQLNDTAAQSTEDNQVFQDVEVFPIHFPYEPPHS